MSVNRVIFPVKRLRLVLLAGLHAMQDIFGRIPAGRTPAHIGGMADHAPSLRSEAPLFQRKNLLAWLRGSRLEKQHSLDAYSARVQAAFREGTGDGKGLIPIWRRHLAAPSLPDIPASPRLQSKRRTDPLPIPDGSPPPRNRRRRPPYSLRFP